MAQYKAMFAVLSASALFAATPALALSVSTGVNAHVDVGGNGVVIDGATQTQGSSTGAMSDSGSAQANAAVAVPLVVTHADVSGDSSQSTTIEIGTISSRADLSGYIASKIKSDAALSSVDTASDHVSVTYDEPGLFLGIIPVSVQTTATTDASGNVTVSRPWWDFLTASDQETLQTRVQASVDRILTATTSSNAQLSLSQQAQLESAIQAAMSTSASAHAAGSASTK